MMDQILSALKCVNCRDTLSKPVLLPCGHTICQIHTEIAEAQIICFKCGCRHFNTGFIINEAVSDMIKAQLYNFDFGHQHKETSNSFERLKKQLDKNNLVLNDLEYFIHESIGELRNHVMLKSEQLKLRIDEITQELIDDLDEYEKRCKRQSGDINRTESFISLTNEIKEFDKGAKKMWEDGSRILNELKFDSDKWREIKAKCDETLQKMYKNLKHFEKEVFLNEFNLKKRHIDFFRKANIDIILKVTFLLFF